MNLLAVDIGNTMIDLGFFRGGKLLYSCRIPSDKCRTSAGFLKLFPKNSLGKMPGLRVAYASVVPEVERAFRSAMRRLTGREPLAIGPKSPLGFRVRYRPLSSLGRDRLAAAAGAVELAGAPVIVVDFGTAITVDAVSRKGVFLGGAIAPGPALSARALARGTARLPLSRLAPPRKAIGKSTKECLSSGIVLGLASLADGLVERMRREMGGKPAPVLATGGAAALVAPFSRTMRRVVPGLVLRGIQAVAQRADAKKRV